MEIHLCLPPDRWPGSGICGFTWVNILAASPETRGIYTSQGGGEFGPDVKRAGYDALVIRGASARPVKNGASSFSQAFAKNPRSFHAVLKTYGTFGLLMLNQGIGNLPVNNYKRAWMDDADFNSAIAHDRIGETVVGKRNPCRGCYLGCKKKSASDAEHSALAEYESMAMLGPNLGIRDLNRRTCREPSLGSASATFTARIPATT